MTKEQDCLEKNKRLLTKHTWPIGRIAFSGRFGGDVKQRQTKI